MDALNIYSELNKSIDGNPEENYNVFLKLIKDFKDECLPKIVVKYKKTNTKNVNDRLLKNTKKSTL